jgi:putative copper resistance protein D
MPSSALWWLTDWRPGWFGVALAVLTGSVYGLLLVRGRRGGVRWPWWRVGCYAVVGVGSLLYAVCGPLQVHRASIFWIGALQVGVLSAVTPAGLSMGDPVGLVRAVPGPVVVRLDHLLQGWPVRVLTFPLVASVLAVGSVVLVFFTDYFEASTRSPLVEAILVVHLVGTGLLFVLPLLTDQMLPAWASPPLRTLVAFADGLLDAVPGIMLMVSTTVLAPGYPGFAGLSSAQALWEQRWGGGVLLGVTEVVGVPVLAAIFVDWVRHDEREARVADALADGPQPEPDSHAVPPGTVEDKREDQGDDKGVRGRDAAGERRLWWEDDPRFADRIYRRR